LSEGPTAARSGLRKRSVVVAGHRTSLSIEQPFWDALQDIATARGLSLNRLVEEIDRARAADGGNLSSAVRVYVLRAVLATGGRGA
jgi:predicted DNA-binding ribbon-helix-helix protein